MIWITLAVILGLIILLYNLSTWEHWWSKILVLMFGLPSFSLIGIVIGTLFTIMVSWPFIPYIKTIETEEYTKHLISVKNVDNSKIYFITEDGLEYENSSDVIIQRGKEPQIKKVSIEFENRAWYWIFIPKETSKTYIILPENYEFS